MMIEGFVIAIIIIIGASRWYTTYHITQSIDNLSKKISRLPFEFNASFDHMDKVVRAYNNIDEEYDFIRKSEKLLKDEDFILDLVDIIPDAFPSVVCFDMIAKPFSDKPFSEALMEKIAENITKVVNKLKNKED